MDDGVKAFSTARRAGQMVVALAVRWGRERVASDQVAEDGRTSFACAIVSAKSSRQSERERRMDEGEEK